MAVGHRLAQRDILTVSDVLDEPFPDGTRLHPEWTAFWTLDAPRGGPAKRAGDPVDDAAAALDVVAAGRAIAIAPDWVAWGLSHPGVVSLAVSDAPPVASRMVWRADEDDPAVLGLVDLATAWSRRCSAGRCAREPSVAPPARPAVAPAPLTREAAGQLELFELFGALESDGPADWTRTVEAHGGNDTAGEAEQRG